MIDLHFDLLTKLYTSYLENDFTFIEEFSKNFNKYNVSGVIANMCFMSKKEMEEEYSKHYFDDSVSVVEMFLVSKMLLEEYLDIDSYIMSIEGCDYVDINDLDTLKELGLKAIVPVWNEKNRLGSGNRSDIGLTKEGVKFIWHAFELGLGVDLSHANKNTFDDIIEVAKIAASTELEPIIYASHSNCYSLCDRDRNLTDEQLLKIKELNGVVGLFSNRGFVYKDSFKNKTDNELVKDRYLEHIKHLDTLFGGIDNICLSTDDMTFASDKDPDYALCPIFDYSRIKKDLIQLISKEYTEEEAYKIMYGNASKLFERINHKERGIEYVKRK